MDSHDTPRTGPIEVFSCDVFDTFLLRRCAGPEGVFERAFALAPIPAPHRHQTEAFIRQRQLAEAAAREAGLARHGTAEITMDEVYQHFPAALFGLTAEDWPKLVAAEFEAERELCFANPELVEPLRQLRLTGMRVGFVADTCWSAPHLTQLLQDCAPQLEWDFLFASCDLRAGKADTLFTQALHQLQVSPRAAAHLGDNDFADVVSARTLGIHAIRYPQAGAALAVRVQGEGEMFDQWWGTDGASRRLDGGIRTIRRAIAARAPSGSAAFDFGMQVLGPVMAAFDRFVATRVDGLIGEDGPVAVVFVGEHGLLPLEIWRVLRDIPALHLPSGTLADLRATLPTLDLCRHTVIVVDADGDGIALPALRAASNAAGLPHRLHGLHLLGNGDGGGECLLPGHIMPSPLGDAVRAHMAVFHQLCGATGTGTPFREMCDMVRLGAAYFAREAAAMAGLADTLSSPAALPWVAAILSRALLHPSDDERALLAALRHDGGGGDTPCGTAEIALISQGAERNITVNRLRNGQGDIRLRVAVTRDGDGMAVAVPAAALPARGTVRAVTLQSGDSTVEAMRNPRIHTLPLAAIQPEDMTLVRGIYHTQCGQGRLLIELPPLDRAMGVVTLTVSPLAEAC